MASIKSNVIRKRQKPLEWHGKTKTREYQIWAAMIARCVNPKCVKWKHYGGRGISVCLRWRNSFCDFLYDMGACPPKHTIDRIDSNGNYEPENCRWITMMEQARNKCNNIVFTINGKTKCLTDWVAESGASYGTVYGRIKRGMSIESALSNTQPRRGTMLSHNGTTQNIRLWSKQTGIASATISKRLASGWTVADALTRPSGKYKCKRR